MTPIKRGKALDRYPILRLLVPFVVGILLGGAIDSVILPGVLLVSGIIAYAVMRIASKTPQAAYNLRPWWIVPISVASLSAGWLNANMQAPCDQSLDTINGKTAIMRVEDINYTDYSMSIEGQLLKIYDSDGQQLEKEQKVLVTTRGCNYNLRPGDITLFRTKFKPVQGLGNPDGFDYARYLKNKGILYAQHIDADKLTVTGHKPTIINNAICLRNQIEHKIYNTQLDENTQQFIVATLLGKSKVIDHETRSSFANAGIAHILALSGLHIGIVMLIVWFALYPLEHFMMRRIRLVMTIVILLGYAVFTGMSPSVMRATIMAIVALTAMVMYRKSVSLNTLSSAAFLILLFSPMSIYDVGFQFSFATVTALLVVFGSNKIQPHSLRSRLAGIVFTSVVAMAATFILSAYYFHKVSLASVLVNTVVIPLFPLFMACAVIFVVLCCAGSEVKLLNDVLDWQYTGLSQLAKWIDGQPLAKLDSLYIPGLDVILYYVALITFVTWIVNHRNFWLAATIAVFAAMAVHMSVCYFNTPTSGFVVFNSYHDTPILWFGNGTGVLWVPDGQPDVAQFKQYNNGFIAHYHIDRIEELNIKGDVMVLGDKRIVHAGREKPGPATIVDGHNADFLIVTKGCKMSIDELNKLFKPKKIVMSGSLYEDTRNKFEDECSLISTPFHTIASNGAFVELK